MFPFFPFQAASNYAQQFYEKYWLRLEEPGDFPECLQLQHAGPIIYMTIAPRLNLSPIPPVDASDLPFLGDPERPLEESDDEKENIPPNY